MLESERGSIPGLWLLALRCPFTEEGERRSTDEVEVSLSEPEGRWVWSEGASDDVDVGEVRVSRLEGAAVLGIAAVDLERVGDAGGDDALIPSLTGGIFVTSCASFCCSSLAADFELTGDTVVEGTLGDAVKETGREAVGIGGGGGEDDALTKASSCSDSDSVLESDSDSDASGLSSP